ncbi:bifunctional glutamate--cysteine ligase GshA/glutathione synthetase GshB [Clostridium paridis]|uniref:Glutathione biosynthesis bifunctional protein GshAB n=1 Tax=Clostridium paridis TaxID=2803863 RepID=A0A937K4V3_9CLOT|nr:bifunctional glutamate--cysteine ligase GshA/glutathione synthetase GshB [Clostridium paridis]MBL4933671.1 bifunctional glutamate--cysteine ligase GshA/glutathione synthetase GshB [Clostridium paridis]
MERIDNKLLESILTEDIVTKLFKGNFGLEKENVRVSKDGKLSLTPHPAIFGDKLKNPYIKTDFSESQVEVITPVCNSIDELYDYIENLQNIVSLSIGEEYLWPQSNPPILPSNEEIPIAVFSEEGKEERLYREKLSEKYGRKKQLLSGIHYNFSFKEEFINSLYKSLGEGESLKEFKNKIYLKITRNFIKYRWFLIYLTGASPVFHETYLDRCTDDIQELADRSCYFKNMMSLRNSKWGYKNKEDYLVNYDSLEQYIGSIQRLINDGKLDNASEFYGPVRLKSTCKRCSQEKLMKDGIEYLEIRILDLNPLNKNGIFIEDLYLVHLFMIYMLFMKEGTLTESEQKIANINHKVATMAGRREDSFIYNNVGEKASFKEEALKIIDDLIDIVNKMDYKTDYLRKVIESAREKVLDVSKTYAAVITKEIIDSSYVSFHLNKAKDYYEESKRQDFSLIGYEDLELSTQILLKNAIKRGIGVEVLDREENFVRLKKDNKVEYVKQATKTSKDSYSTVLVMENKVVTKEVLKENGVRVPSGKNYNSIEDARADYELFKDKQIVVKPKSTNFGIGISIFKEEFSKGDFTRALEIAFENDKTALVEEFISGKEYRFLVIADEVVGILHRVPANVQGDGARTISELVKEKNKHPLRGKGYKTPLEKISLGEIEEMFLKAQGKNFDYVPKEGEIVYLRENSNISTGGDSIDFTDEMHESYKTMAIKSAKAAGATICGVDMMIQDIKVPLNESNYGIIELNFNPAIHIHCYPYIGKNRGAGDKVLDVLFGK